ncbi:MAG: mechanosensitive ion channel [Verrucomicrobiae bacterium]|nr:mechanosensitive ion channel [Verrucomicrobiae bacterium]
MNHADWSERLNELGMRLEPHVGGWVHWETILGITWLQLALSGAVLGIVAVAWHLVCPWLKRRVGRPPEEAAGEAALDPGAARRQVAKWRVWREVLEAALPPLTLWVWIWGGTAAGSILFLHWDSEESPSLVLGALAWVREVGTFGTVLWLLIRMVDVVGRQLKRWSARTGRRWDDVIGTLVTQGLRLVLPLVGVILVLPTLSIPEAAQELFQRGSSLLLIGAIGYVVYRLVRAAETAVLAQYRIDVKDNLAARKIFTQVQVLRKLAVVVIVVLTAGSMLMVFEPVRQLGASILASAGVLGIVVGFAAQRSIATVVAGFQIAMTQPIRVDDVVIVENEWGRIEEITLTYVVVRIWDLRRLVVPIGYFIERPFQNWTRVSADILGSVFLHVDYTMPVDELRPEVGRIVKSCEDWDGKFWNLQVTEATERTVQLRVLATSEDASRAWNLRCEIREKLLALIQRKYPGALPKVRAELPLPTGPGIAGGAGGATGMTVSAGPGGGEGKGFQTT